MATPEEFLLEEAEGWANEGLITAATLATLRARYAPSPQEARGRLLVRAALAVGVVLFLLGVLRFVTDLKLDVRALTGVQAVLAVLALAAGLHMRRTAPEARAWGALVTLGAMFYLAAIGLGGYAFGAFDNLSRPWLLLWGGLGVGAIALWARNVMLHGLGLTLLTGAIGIWLHRAGMPARFLPLTLGVGVAGAGLALGRTMPILFRLLYLTSGLGAMAFGAWFLEIEASGAAQAAYAGLFTLCCALPFGLGVRERDDVLAGMGILLLVADVYTQYYVLLWNAAPRTLFFLIGGLLTLGFGIAYERYLRYVGTHPEGWRTFFKR